MKKLKSIVSAGGFFLLLFSCGNTGNNGSNTEKVNLENTYIASIAIGNQVWSASNLDVSTFRNGDAITEAKTNEEWEKLGSEQKPAWCYYNNDPANGKKYGKLYNWYAANDARGIAPTGWHVPSHTDWKVLTTFLGGEKVAGGKLKETGTTHWISPNAGANNSSGFTAIPCGQRGFGGEFYDLENGNWWSTTESEPGRAWNRKMSSSGSSVSYWSYNKEFGLSIRCVKD